MRRLDDALQTLREAMRQAGIERMTVEAAPHSPLESDDVHPGLRLKRWRVAQGWTQAQLGEALGYKIKVPSNRKASICEMIAQIETQRCGISKSRRAKAEELTGIPAGAWLLAEYRWRKSPKVRKA